MRSRRDKRNNKKEKRLSEKMNGFSRDFTTLIRRA
jgi:hypothetical protein